MKLQPYNLKTDQFAKMVEFYGKTLQLKTGEGLEECFNDCGCSIMIRHLGEDEQRGDLQRITLFYTPPLEEVAEGLQARGIAVKNRNGTHYFRDPDCNEIVLSAAPA